MDGNGKVIYNEMSYKNKNELIVLLKKYALNTSFLSRDLINYYKKSNFNTSFRLASKYQDYAIYVDMSIRRDLLNLSKDYFNDAKKYLRNSELENKKAFLQIIDLFNIQVKLISNNPEKALNLLQKLDRDKIDKINKTFYSFLNYTAYKQLNDIENVSFWEKELLDRDIKKANLIIKNNS